MVPKKFVALNEQIFGYLIKCRSGAGDPVLAALRRETLRRFPEDAQMQIGPDQGEFMTLLAAALGARHAIEVGTFTGYSSICLARGLRAGGRLLCLDASAEWTAVARRYWARAGVADKIELRLGPALPALRALPAARRYDLAFIDAEKTEYADYYELVLPRMKINGVILFDNMLRHGRLAGPGPLRDPRDRAIAALNRRLARDSRVQAVLLPVGDGVMFCRVLR